MTPEDVVNRLAEDCAWLGDPEQAFDKCIAAATTLRKDMEMAGHEAEVVAVRGWQGSAPYITALGMLPDLWRNVFKPEDYLHFMTWVPDFHGKGQGALVDLTARQFDPEAPFPWVASPEEVAERWSKLPEVVSRAMQPVAESSS